ncbi:hypothetical protein J6590_004660 [Homalodisca vitripennis]|nr:hypothetical protein J6590_004660 [Homalodisca vitripennis]
MSTDVQEIPPKVDTVADKQSRRRSKDTEKAHRRSSNFQNKKFKHDHKFRKRSQSFNSANGKFFPPYKMRKDFRTIIPPTKFLLGGNINDPLNLNSLQDEEINRAMNAVTPKSSPLPTPRHRKGEIEVIIPPDITDPLNLIAGDDDATYEAMLTSPVKRTQKRQKKSKKRKNHRSSSGAGSGKEDSIEGAKLDEPDPLLAVAQTSETSAEASSKNETETAASTSKEPQAPPPQKKKSDGANKRANLRKMELKDHKADLDKIVSPVIPQPGAWNDRHRFRPPPQRTPQINKAKATPKFKESNSRFQYGNYNRYYGYRNPNAAPDMRLKVLEKQKHLFAGKDVLDIGCNTGHLTLAIARDFGPNKVVGLDIDRSLIDIARVNIKHYVNCGKKDKYFPVSMPIVYGPIDVPGASPGKAFPNNVSFVVGNYVLENDVLVSMEQPQFDVILCLSITKWIQLNFGDAGLKRAFRRMYAQLRPGGVLILEAQSWGSYQRKKQLTGYKVDITPLALGQKDIFVPFMSVSREINFLRKNSQKLFFNIVTIPLNASGEPRGQFFYACLEEVSHISFTHFSTSSFTSSSGEDLFPLMCTLREVKRWKSEGARSGAYGGSSKRPIQKSPGVASWHWPCEACSGQPSFVSSNNRVEKIIAFESVVFQKLFGALHSIQLVLFCQLFWDPPRRQFPISESFCDCFVYQGSGDLRKHRRKFN